MISLSGNTTSRYGDKIDLENVQYNLELGCCYYSEQVDGTRFDLTSSADLCQHGALSVASLLF